MNLVTVRLVDLNFSAGRGWHYDDIALQSRLEASVRAFGQLRPLLVRTDLNGLYEVLDGRKLASALVATGSEQAVAVALGRLTDTEADRLQLALLVQFDVDYPRVGQAVAGLCESGVPEAELAGCSPFTAERIGYFRKLATFDWRTFNEVADDQHAMDWNAAYEDVPSEARPALSSPPEPAPDFLPLVAMLPTSSPSVGAQESLF